jgi:hypothetical protein
MKNFVIATVSVVALLGVAHAEEQVQIQQHPAPTIAEQKAAAPMAAQPAAPAHKAAAHHKAHHAHKHHAEHCGHKHHKHHAHHRHHGHHRHHMAHGALAVRVNFPPTCIPDTCQPTCYENMTGCDYMWHEGYFWYPHARADMLAGYAPYQRGGSYWYPSRLHPHAVYVEGQSFFHPELVPVEEGAPMRGMSHRDRRAAHAHGAKMHHKAAAMKAHHAAAHAAHPAMPAAAPGAMPAAQPAMQQPTKE